MCTMELVDNKWVYLNKFDSYVLITEPPLLKDVDVSEYLNTPFVSSLPCHTQSVERMVAVTTSVSKAAVGRLNQSAEGMLKVKGRAECRKVNGRKK